MLESWRKSHTAAERSIWKLREDLSTLPEAAGEEAEPPRFKVRSFTSIDLALS